MYVVSYDISSDRLRNKVAEVLLEYGRRIQYSVFECEISEKKFGELYARLCKLTLDARDSYIRIYLICANCISKIQVIGEPKEDAKYNREEVIIV